MIPVILDKALMPMEHQCFVSRGQITYFSAWQNKTTPLKPTTGPDLKIRLHGLPCKPLYLSRLSASLSLFLTSHLFPFFLSSSTSLTPPCPLCPRVLDIIRPCHDRLLLCSFLFFKTPLTSSVTGERGKKKNEVKSEEEGWIYWLEAQAQVDASESGSWWMMRPQGVRDNFIQARSLALIYSGLPPIYARHSF